MQGQPQEQVAARPEEAHENAGLAAFHDCHG